jgi:hypothetical protein
VPDCDRIACVFAITHRHILVGNKTSDLHSLVSFTSWALLVSLNRVYSFIPSRRALLTILVSSVAGAALAVAGSGWVELPKTPATDPGPPHDPRFVMLGKAYVPQLGNAYAEAWAEGAKALDAGKSISVALEAVSKAWTSNRTVLFDQVLTPQLAKIVSESVRDSDVTQAERAALAAAWRGLASGLTQ